MAEDDFSIEDLNAPPENEMKARQFIVMVQELANRYPDLKFNPVLEQYNPEDIDEDVKTLQEEGKTDQAQIAQEISDQMDEDSSESRVATKVSGNDEGNINNALEEMNVMALDLGGRVAVKQNPTENMRLAPFVSNENPEGYVDGNRFKSDTVYAFGPSDDPEE